MKLTASDFYTHFRPEKCELRVFLRHRGEPEAEPGPFEQVIRRLGERHEKSHLATLGPVDDLSVVSPEDRERQTREAVARCAPVIYQGVLRASVQLGCQDCDVSGDPDFLIRQNGGYTIRDSKMARKITNDDHPEILLQLQLYGWLYEQSFGQPPVALEVHSGTGEIVAIPYDGGTSALAELELLVRIRQLTSEPYSPVGWSKCGGCGFRDRCWPAAEHRQDVALVAGVDQGLARVLRDRGVTTVEQLLATFDENALAEFQRPSGSRMQRIGKRAGSILTMASAMKSGKEILLAKPDIPQSPNYVMFDLEGLPPTLNELDKIYLWGFQVFGQNPGPFQAATAGFGEDGDRHGWEEFLTKASAVFAQHGDLPFVHWAIYERVQLDKYVKRYGDRDGVAARVRKNLLDLHPVTVRSIALPLPSYSLKVVEKYIGFKRTQDEYGGEWAMAKYIEATEMQDEQARADVMTQILRYNEEDLAATWAVLQWLESRSG